MTRRVILGALLLAAAVSLALGARTGGAARRPRATAATASPAPPPERAPAPWTGGVAPRALAPGVLARVASRTRAEAAGPARATSGAAARGSGPTGPETTAAHGGRERAERAEACDKRADTIQSVEIEWDAGDDP